jgi:hypothetical protein
MAEVVGRFLHPPKVRPVVTCVFCGLSRLASIEDVVPKWIRYALDPASSVTVRAEPGGATARMQHLVVTLHDMVCEAPRVRNRRPKPA